MNNPPGLQRMNHYVKKHIELSRVKNHVPGVASV